MAKPCTPHLIPQAEQFFEIETANVGGRGALPSRSLGGPRGPFSHVREWPPYSVQRQRRCLPPRTRARTWHYVLFLFRIRSPLLREPHKIIHTRVVKPREPDEHVARDVALAGLVVGIADLRAAQIVRQALCVRSLSSLKSRMRRYILLHSIQNSCLDSVKKYT